MGNKTALFQKHLDAGAKIVDFSGWDMPIHYGSQIEEHHKVRRSAGMFDVSHMTVVDISGAEATAFLQKLLANDVAKLTLDGKALYSGMLNVNGGIIDDLIVYRTDPGYRLVVNCATREKDLNWINKHADGFPVEVEERPEIALLAVQGPRAVDKVTSFLKGATAESVRNLKPFRSLAQDDWRFCRTGYTGEDGLEIMLPEADIASFWQQLLSEGVAPCGLGARDTLRLEAGMNLYGTDMDENITPQEANMGWTVALKDDRKFIGRQALEAKNTSHRLTGLIFRGRGVLRGHQEVITPDGKGEITSGSFSPTLGFSIALARIPAGDYKTVKVLLRSKEVEAEVVAPPFVRNGKAVFKQ